MFKKVDDLRIYAIANSLANKIWQEVSVWNHFAKQTIGRQLVSAIDSVAANIAEGHGRHHFKATVNFLYYSRGSLSETKCWLEKAYYRSLLRKEKFEYFISCLRELAPQLNSFITLINKKALKTCSSSKPVNQSTSKLKRRPNVN